jgi:hypothetical protein
LFLFIMTSLVCHLNLLHIGRENSEEWKVSDFALGGQVMPFRNEHLNYSMKNNKEVKMLDYSWRWNSPLVSLTASSSGWSLQYTRHVTVLISRSVSQ